MYLIRVVLFLILVADGASAQCTALKADAPNSDFIAFLRQSEQVPDTQKDSECISLALKQFNYRRSPDAIDVLVNYLGFGRPLTEAEQQGFSSHGGARNIGDRYPATGALMMIGRTAIPALLSAIKTSRSPVVRRNGAYTIMQIFRTDSVDGIETLKREAAKSEGVAKSNLNEAAKVGLEWCDDTKRVQCKAAANGPSK